MRVYGEEANRVLALVADPESWGILRSLLIMPKDASALEKELGMPHSTLYRRLTQLRGSGLLMVDEFVIKPGGKRDAILAATFQAIRFVAVREGIEIEVVETQKSIERRWFRLFTRTRPPDLMEDPVKA